MLKEMGIAVPMESEPKLREAEPVGARGAQGAPVAEVAQVARVAKVAQPPAPPRAALDALDWPSLQAAVAACEACGLSRSRRHTVFGVGHAQAHWMIVGEAPGEQEDARGEPFVGAAGQLLDNMLRAVGLTRAEGPADRQVFITNTLKCRPPQNRNPEPRELASCAPYLRQQIALVKPRMLLAMGRFAVQQLLGSTEALGKLRGRVHTYEGIPVVVTYHPAYLLRNPADKAKAWEDLCLAVSTLKSS